MDIFEYEAVCPTYRDADGEVTGLCVQCGEWCPLDSDLAANGVCHECKETLYDEHWEMVDQLIGLIQKWMQSGEIRDIADQIDEHMTTIGGAYAAPDPRDKEDV